MPEICLVKALIPFDMRLSLENQVPKNWIADLESTNMRAMLHFSDINNGQNGTRTWFFYPLRNLLYHSLKTEHNVREIEKILSISIHWRKSFDPINSNLDIYRRYNFSIRNRSIWSLADKCIQVKRYSNKMYSGEGIQQYNVFRLGDTAVKWIQVRG